MRQHRNRQIAGKSVGDRIADFVDRHMCGVFITPAFLVTILLLAIRYVSVYITVLPIRVCWEKRLNSLDLTITFRFCRIRIFTMRCGIPLCIP